MSGHVRAAVVVPVILHEVVHVMEDQTVPVQVLYGLLIAHIEQHGSVKWFCSYLKKKKGIKKKIQPFLTEKHMEFFQAWF